jgi:VWFA-related protein
MNRTLLTLGLLAVSATTLAQQAPQQPFTLQVTSQIVVLDVVVTNSKGEVVKNLTRDDFQIFENKKPQTILSFEDATKAAAVAATPAPAINSTQELDAKEPDAPVSIIVLDELTTKFEDMAFARYSLKKYLGTQGDTLTQPTMLVSANLRNLTVLRDYTTSKKEILDALDHHFAAFPWQAQNPSWQGEQIGSAFASLMEVAEATNGHPGHKNMVWIGRGFPTVDTTNMDPDTADQFEQLIAKCANMLRDARVTLYAVDPAGLSVEPPAQDEDGFYVESPFGGEVDFDEMAEATGGQAFHGRNDVDSLIGASVAGGVSFYTLTYRPTTVSQDPKEFRRIQVFMRDRNLHATTREGYFAATPPPDPALDAKGKPSGQLTFDLNVAGQSLMVYDGLQFAILRDPRKPDEYNLRVSGKDLVWQTRADGKLTAQVAIAALTFDRKGKLLDHRVVLDDFGADAEGREPRAVVVKVTMPSGPPVARLRFVLRSTGNGRVGAENVFLVDPKTLSGDDTGRNWNTGRSSRR